MPVAPETVDGYFEQYQWTFQRLDDNNWRTGFRGDVASYTIRVRTWQNWIYFTIVPFAVAPKKECWPRLHYYMLRANHEMNAAKFYVDNDNDVVLSVELPADDLAYSEFERALNALSWYADEHYLNVLNLAQTPGAPSKYEQGEQKDAAAATPGEGEPSTDLDWGDGDDDDTDDSSSGGDSTPPTPTPSA